MREKIALFLFALFMPLIFCRYAPAAVFQPGFRSLGNYIQEPRSRLDIGIWYPCARQPREVAFSQWKIRAAANARPAAGKFPVLVLSHPTPGTRFSYHELAAFLAKNGYIVIAPKHERDCMDNMDDFFTWKQFSRRMGEVKLALEIARDDKSIGAAMDMARLGFIGFGSGATTGLLLGGARPNGETWPGYCENPSRQSSYCNSWAKEKMEKLIDGLPAEWKPPAHEFRAMALVSPVFEILFNHNSFKDYYPPTLLVGAGRERGQFMGAQCRHLQTLIGPNAACLELGEADTGALMSPCPDFLATELPEICASLDAEGKKKLASGLREALAGFFAEHLGERATQPGSEQKDTDMRK